MSSEETERELATELRVLERFRREHALRYPGARVDRDDPDVQRMIEAVALTAVRTRRAMQLNVQRLWHRLCGSYFDFLMAPLPSCAIVQANITPRLVEVQRVTRGSQMQLTNENGQTATYTTLEDLRILPLQLGDVEVQRNAGRCLLTLSFATRFPRTDAVGMLRLHIRCGGHYTSALGLLFGLRKHLLRATVQYGAMSEVDESMPCDVSFGSVSDRPFDNDPENPIETVRRFFHFPERELYINLLVPQSPKPWQHLLVRLELDGAYVADPLPGRDTFQLHTVPVENRVRTPASQVTHDGTQAAHPILHVDPSQRATLLRVRGAYRVESRGLFPLRPTSMSATDSRDCYEIEGNLVEREAHACLVVRDPLALVDEVKFHLDCEWHQPWFAEQTQGAIRAMLPLRALEGVQLEVAGGVTAPSANTLSRTTSGMLQLLALRMKPTLTTEELHQVLDALGSVQLSPYRGLPRTLRVLSVEPAIDASAQGTVFSHQYLVTMEPFSPEEEPLIWHFLHQMLRLLDAWNSEARVELIVESGTSKLSLPLGGGRA